VSKEHQGYIPRLVDKHISLQLKTMGAVLIEGPKWCGKTRTSLQHSESVFYTTDNRELARNLPNQVLEGDVPRLIDEWQLEPVLWDRARRIVDERAAPGQFIFTGSSTSTAKETAHSGVGRFAPVRMGTLSLFESGESNGAVSLADLFDGKAITFQENTASLESVVWALCRGGWPATLNLDTEAASLVAPNYVNLMQQNEFTSSSKGAPLDVQKLQLFIQGLARNTAQATSLSTIISDVRERAGTLARATAENYLNNLKSVFFAVEQPSWNVSLRSKAALRQMPKRHLADPSLAAAALGATPEKLLKDYRTLGHLFESLCYRDMCAYAHAINASVLYYRDSNNFEVDQIVATADGRWAALEVKLGTEQIDETAKQLSELVEKVDTRHIGEPSFLGILYSGQYAYTRDDGVHVIPLSCLRP